MLDDTPQSGKRYRIFKGILTPFKSSAPKPMIDLRFTSLAMLGAGVKGSKIDAALMGFTCNLYPYFNWTADLIDFLKSPPGVSDCPIAFKTVYGFEKFI